MRRSFHWKAILGAVVWEAAASMLIAIGIYNFAVYAEFPMTGFSGIAMILNRLFGLPIGIVIVALNIPVAIWSYHLLGKGFFLRSVRCMLISSWMIDYVAPLLPAYRGDRLLSAVCTGVIAGLGYALIFMRNSSTGGTDFIIMAVKTMKPHIPLGRIAFWSDVGIILFGGLLFQDIDGIIYGMIINYLFAIVVDKVMYGINAGKLTLIVTSHGQQIANVIEACCGRGSTLLKAVGGFRQEEKEVVMCASSNKQMYLMQKAVKEADPESFMIILESNEIHGEGFHTLQLGEKEG